MFKLTVCLCLLGAALATPPVTRTKEEIQAFSEYLQSTRNSDGVNVMSKLVQHPDANAEELSGKFDGDIILDDFIMEDMIQSYSMGRNAYIWPDTKWPQDTVVWEIGEGEFNEEQVEAIWAAVRDIENNTCIKFRYREPEDTVYVRLTGSFSGCYAHVGYWQSRGVHNLNLARDEIGVACFRHATIVHEFLHIIGFLHMQSTWNRNDYVKIVEENLQAGTENNFAIYDQTLVSNLGVEYDYISCMHYGPYAFSKNGQMTIVALKEYEGTMGQRVYVRDSDWLRVNRHYNCPGAWN